MHGFNQGSGLLVNAEVDSMGGVVDSGVGITQKTSPRRAAIEKAQTELRQEYDVREERRRELEFLEKGGNPLDFKFGNAASISVQSTSHTDQHQEQFVTSKAKGSFALTASPHGDSVESSGRPEAPSVWEPNSADNLLLFDGEHESLEGAKISVHLSRKNTTSPPEQSSQMVQSQNVKDSEDSAIFRPYARRNRTRTNRDYSRGVSKDAKGPLPETNKQRDQNVPPISKLKPGSLNGNIASKDQASTIPSVMELDGMRSNDVSCSSVPNDKLHAVVSENFKEEEQNIRSQDCIVPSNTVVACDHANAVEDREQVSLANLEHPHCATTVKSEIVAGFSQPNGLSSLMDDRKGKLDLGQVSSAAIGTKGLESESSCTRTSVGANVNNDSDMCIDKENTVSIRDAVERKPEFTKEQNLVSSEILKERNENNTATASSVVDDNNDQSFLCQNDSMVKSEDDLLVSTSVMQEFNDPSDVKGIQQNEHSLPKSNKKEDVILSELPMHDVEQVALKQQNLVESSNIVIPQTTTTERDAPAFHDSLSCPADCLKLVDKAHEDSILDKAHIIQAKRKRIAELSARTSPPQSCWKSHWDFVLEEMAWLANDFAQERLWKLSAAVQSCHQAAFASRQRLDRQTKYWKMKSLSHDIAKSVMQFWQRAELFLDRDCTGLESRIVSPEGVHEKRNTMIKSEDFDGQHSNKTVQGYAVRFVKYNRSLTSSPQAEGPVTPDSRSGLYTEDLSWGEQLTQETLFYMVPATAMEVYRKSIESHFADEKCGTSAQEEVETSTHYAIEFGSEEFYEDYEGEPSTHYLPGAFERNKLLKYAQKKQKATVKSYTHRISETGTDLAYGQCMVAAPQSAVIGKRPGSVYVGQIPTKRMRTSVRQRVLSPFGSGVTGAAHAQNKTDASSGETHSFQDDQSTSHGGSQMQKCSEVESAGEFEKNLAYDCAETSIKSKKKKTKQLGSAYDQGWQMDSAVYNEQKDHTTRRLDSHYFDSNGTSGLSPHHVAKKPKMMNKSVESTYDNVSPMTGSLPSPATSQMSDMPNQSRLIKLITGSGRDKGRKTKTIKMSSVQPGTGIPWSLFEDQALVVLVHDMGPNWELISDAMNSTLQFKCIFRKPKECKERHKTLMERGSGDGADSADDSGSSQSYPSTLPGIPKGSARQLFQRLQGPMEEDTLKSHFDKIIRLGQKQQFHKNQNGNQDPKQIVPAHSSHAAALSQVPNYKNGVVLKPLELCDATASAPVIIPLGYQGTHGNGLALPTAGVNSTIQGSSGMVTGNNLPSPSGQLAASMRDSQCGIARASLPVDEQQRIQQLNQMLSSRNVQQPALSIPSSLPGSDRGVRMLPGGNGMGIMCGMSRSMPVSRPGFQGMASSSMLSSGSLISTSMVGIASPVNMHTGAGPPGQGNSIVRSGDALHVMRPGHNPEHQRQMVPDLQMQVTQGNGQGVPAFNGLSSACNNQTIPGTVQPFPGHGQQQQSHHCSPHHSHLQGSNSAANSQQQAYAIRIAKERQLQQRYLQQQHQFAASSALMPPVQSQSQLPVSSSLQNSSPIQSQGSPQPMSPLAVTPSSPLTSISSQHQRKHHLPQHGISRTPATSGLSNQAVKQRQRHVHQQQFQQGSRQHPNQRQHAKLLNGIGRGNMQAHQNISVDSSHLNGTSIAPGSQTGDKGDQISQIMQGQGLYSGSALNSSQPSKPFVPQSNNLQLQQRVRSSPATTSVKQVQQSLPSDSCNQSQVPLGHVLPTSPPVVPSAASSNHQLVQVQPQSQSLQTQENKNLPSGQRILYQSHLVQSESPNISQAGPSQVEQHPASNANQVSVRSAAPVGRMNMGNTVSNNSTITQLKASEPSHETNTQNPTAKVGLLGSPVAPSIQHLAGKEPSPPINHGLGPRQLSGSLPPHGHSTGAQRHQQLPVALQPSSVHLSQQSFQTSEQQDQQLEQDQHSPKVITLQHQPKQQLQAAQNNLYTGPQNSKVE